MDDRENTIKIGLIVGILFIYGLFYFCEVCRNCVQLIVEYDWDTILGMYCGFLHHAKLDIDRDLLVFKS